MRLKLIGLGMVLLALSVVGCSDPPTADDVQNQKQEQTLDDAVKQIGMPGITNFTEKKLVKKLYELRDQEIATFSYTQDMQGHLWHICDSIGYGLPYGVQFTNPESKHWTQGGAFYQTPQAEPNGLFMPATAEGTWVICAGPKGEPQPMYVEPRVITSPFKLNASGDYQIPK